MAQTRFNGAGSRCMKPWPNTKQANDQKGVRTVAESVVMTARLKMTMQEVLAMHWHKAKQWPNNMLMVSE